MFATKLIYFFAILYYCDAYKVLVVFPIPGRSHSILGEGYVRHLLEAGHEVTYLTPIPIKNPPPGLSQVDVSENLKFLPEGLYDVKKFMYKELDVQDESLLSSIIDELYYKTFRLDNVQKFLMNQNEQFDVAVIEWLYSELGSGFSSVFNCPLIWSSSMQVHSTVLSLIDEIPNPAYNMHHLSKDYSDTFWNRFYQLWLVSKTKYYKWLTRDENNRKFHEIFGPAVSRTGRQLPHFDEVRYNASLMLGNSHVLTGDNVALPQNYIHIGGYHIADTTEPLPKDLQNIMDIAKNGVIYFSMGSMLQSNNIPKEVKNNFLKMFSELKQTVIWKLNDKIKDLPKNVHIISWAPQQSILAHPHCILFITHGGLLSTFETIKFGVPVIGIPFYADQYLNTNRIVSKGFGKRVDISENTPDELRIAIREILGNSSYHVRARQLSSLFSDAEEGPGRRLVRGVELVARTHGAPHLRSQALAVPLYAKLYLDLALLLVAILLVIVVVCKYLMRFVVKSSNYKKKKIRCDDFVDCVFRSFVSF